VKKMDISTPDLKPPPPPQQQRAQRHLPPVPPPTPRRALDDVSRLLPQCQMRGLNASASWLAEIADCLLAKGGGGGGGACGSSGSAQSACELILSLGSDGYTAYCLAKSYLDRGEFLRACAYAKKRPGLDAYCYYLYALVLKSLGYEDQASAALTTSLRQESALWPAWSMLADLVRNRHELEGLVLPRHWMRQFFLVAAYVRLHESGKAELLLNELTAAHGGCLADCAYLMRYLGIVKDQQRSMGEAKAVFKQLFECALDGADVYSNILYVDNNHSLMADLAHQCVLVDKYRPETCCVVGNYYGLRGSHDKALSYFQRALRLRPDYALVWILVGHEYLELKQVSNAIQAYHKAVTFNPADYRGWYGLGHAHELNNKSYYAIYYFRECQRLCNTDPRIMVALGESYSRVSLNEEAKKCYVKAFHLGDPDTMALFRLAELYEHLGEKDNACNAYLMLVSTVIKSGATDTKAEPAAYRFLAQHYLDRNQTEEAAKAAKMCLDYAETKEFGKDLLRQIGLRATAGAGAAVAATGARQQPPTTSSGMSESPSVAPLVGDIGSITQSMLDRWGLFSLLDAELLNRVAFAFVYGANGNEAVLVTGDDCVYCIGNGTRVSPGIISEAHLNVPGGLSVQLDALCGCRVVELASGSGPHLLALTDSGDLYTWGSNSHCQLGNGNTNQLLQPTLSSLLKVCSIACGASHSLALTQDGEVYAWGCNNCGQVGSGTTVNQPSPRRLAGPLTNRRIRRVGACQSASFAVSVAGEVFSWGCNKHGQLGIGGASGANQNVPVRLTVNDVFACMSHPPVTCKRLDFSKFNCHKGLSLAALGCGLSAMPRSGEAAPASASGGGSSVAVRGRMCVMPRSGEAAASVRFWCGPRCRCQSAAGLCVVGIASPVGRLCPGFVARIASPVGEAFEFSCVSSACDRRTRLEVFVRAFRFARTAALIGWSG
uniref:TPR_REGION domain-containing protein n=1 Tax=Macrostomum lignano TaxID=282301 RepID=A0A1I8JFZ7_9PLAT